MTKLVDTDDPAALDLAADALAAGEAIVLPTDTVYGLAALPSATAPLYALKGRPESIPIAVLIESADQVVGMVEWPDAAARLADAFWPGPLTIVVRRRGADDTLGLRCPDHPFVRALAGRVGPLATTSANRHGEPTPSTVTDVLAALHGSVVLAVDGGPCGGVASTVVDVTGPKVVIVRTGPISAEQVEAVALR